MKRLITLLLVFTIFTVNAQDVVVNEKTITETERIIDKYGGKLAESFTEAMESATPIAQEGFKMVVKLQIAKGIANLLPILFFAIFLYLFKRNYDKIAADENRGDPRRGPFDEDNITPLLIVYFVMMCLMFIIACICTYDGLVHIIAPEWFAIKEIADLF